jgi:hypothetical protein
MSSSTRSSNVPSTLTAGAGAGNIRRRRPPVSAVTGAGLQLLQAAVTTFAVFYFSLIDPAKPPLAAGLGFVALYWSANAIGAAGSVGLLRGRELGRRVLIGYGVYGILFSLAKLVIWHESAGVLFGAVDLVLIALAAAPATRRYTS